MGGTGPRLISLAEAADILGVSEETVQAWVDEGRIAPVVGEDGEQRPRLADEGHSRDGAHETRFSVLELQDGADGIPEGFQVELDRERHTRELADLDAGDVDVDALAEALAECLSAVVPPPIRVSARSAMVWITDDRGCRAGSDIARAATWGDAFEDQIRSAVVHTLDSAQETIAEETAESWPATAGQIPGRFAGPFIEFTADHLRLGYGDSAGPVLELTPISLQSVRRTT